jgi:hypothetical protein
MPYTKFIGIKPFIQSVQIKKGFGSYYFTVESVIIPSVNSLTTPIGVALAMSFMKIKNKRGPGTYP